MVNYYCPICEEYKITSFLLNEPNKLEYIEILNIMRKHIENIHTIREVLVWVTGKAIEAT